MREFSHPVLYNYVKTLADSLEECDIMSLIEKDMEKKVSLVRGELKLLCNDLDESLIPVACFDFGKSEFKFFTRKSTSYYSGKVGTCHLDAFTDSFNRKSFLSDVFFTSKIFKFKAPYHYEYPNVIELD
jgi:hypothetical protein